MFCFVVSTPVTLMVQPWPSLMPVPGFLPGQLGPGSCPTEVPGSSGLSPATPFSCRLNSTEYGELCEKLRAPIRSAANVVIRQSLGDLFLETFASLVEVNPAYSVPSSQVGLGRDGVHGGGCPLLVSLWPGPWAWGGFPWGCPAGLL